MDKVIAKVGQTRHNWWDATKQFTRLHGYRYYEPPKELKFRYPAPGSVAHERNDHPNLFKKNWKQPYRDSPYNIRPIEQRWTPDTETENFVSKQPTLDASDPYDQAIARMPDISYDEHSLMFDQEDMSLEERSEELQKAFADIPRVRRSLTDNFAPWGYDLEDDYHQTQWLWTERGFTGMHMDAQMKNIFVDLELFIEEYIGKKFIQDKKRMIYKGTVKKW